MPLFISSHPPFHIHACPFYFSYMPLFIFIHAPFTFLICPLLFSLSPFTLTQASHLTCPHYPDANTFVTGPFYSGMYIVPITKSFSLTHYTSHMFTDRFMLIHYYISSQITFTPQTIYPTDHFTLTQYTSHISPLI